MYRWDLATSVYLLQLLLCSFHRIGKSFFFYIEIVGNISYGMMYQSGDPDPKITSYADIGFGLRFFKRAFCYFHGFGLRLFKRALLFPFHVFAKFTVQFFSILKYTFNLKYFNHIIQDMILLSLVEVFINR